MPPLAFTGVVVSTPVVFQTWAAHVDPPRDQLFQVSHTSLWSLHDESAPNTFCRSLVWSKRFLTSLNASVPTNTTCKSRTYSVTWSSTDQLSFDCSAYLERDSVPKFSGHMKDFEACKASFISYADKGKATPEYKLLRLRECLQAKARGGEPRTFCSSLQGSKDSLGVQIRRKTQGTVDARVPFLQTN